MPCLTAVVVSIGLSACGEKQSSSSIISADTAEKNSAQRSSVEFVCRQWENQGSWTTFVNTNRGSIPMVVWKSLEFVDSGYTPMKRCNDVSDKLQNFYEMGVLNHLVPGYINEYPVICAVKERNQECVEESSILLTLSQGRPIENVNEDIQTLLGVRDDAGSPLENSALPIVSRNSDGNVTINVWSYLQSADVVAESEISQ